MIRLPVHQFLELMKSKEYKVFTREDSKTSLNIIGYRNRFGRVNHFDDTIAVYWKEGLQWNSRYYKATTMPGTPNLLQPVNPKGAAILVPEQYIASHRIGLHRGKYKALVQSGPVKVYRDNTRDNVYDMQKRTIESGLFGINIHRASLTAKVVGADSAGCQVIQDRSDYEDFIALCERVHLNWGESFSYTLVEL